MRFVLYIRRRYSSASLFGVLLLHIKLNICNRWLSSFESLVRINRGGKTVLNLPILNTNGTLLLWQSQKTTHQRCTGKRERRANSFSATASNVVVTQELYAVFSFLPRRDQRIRWSELKDLRPGVLYSSTGVIRRTPDSGRYTPRKYPCIQCTNASQVHCLLISALIPAEI